jgi:hypothetical protein
MRVQLDQLLRDEELACQLSKELHGECAGEERRAQVGPSPDADVAAVRPVPVQMWQGRAQSRCRCGRGGPSPGADLSGAGPVSVQMWRG